MLVDESIQTGNVGQNPRQKLSSRHLRIFASYAECLRGLDQFYGQAKRQILQYQSPTTGLFPSMSNDEIEASIRDSIYCSMAIWSLYQAYIRRVDDSHGKACELGQSVVKCMRGILFAWMRHSREKLEVFKTNQNPRVALPSKVNLTTSLPLEDDKNGRHLQLDIVSLYLLFMVQAINSGLQIIYTMDEVHFIQNLVYYIERTYRTPDYGMWEHGSLFNPETPEVHASSIGMAKSALESINGVNLFGEKGAAWSVIHVDIDAHSRNRRTFETLLPRESISKNTDASLLPTISWPCFATHDSVLYNSTKHRIVDLLKTPYGFKRFLKDGYGTSATLNNVNRNYSPQEIKRFENIECTWPVFCLFMIIDAIFKNNELQLAEYKELLFENLLRREPSHGDPIVPQFYYVPPEYIDSERISPNSLPRFSNTEGEAFQSLHLMSQSVLLVAQLLIGGFLDIKELDPIRRYSPSYERNRKNGPNSVIQGKLYGTAAELVVQVVLISESTRLKAMMATYGIQTQTPVEVEPVKIWSSSQLVKIYEYLGINEKLGLKGRPPRPIGSLGTSKLYRILGRTVLCYPLIFENSDFYLSNDMALLIDDIKNELNFIGKYWRMSGRPTVCIMLREENLRDVNFKEMLDLLVEFKKGYLTSTGLKIKTGRLQNLISSSSIEHLDFTEQFSQELEKLPELQSFKQPEHKNESGFELFDNYSENINYAESNDFNSRTYESQSTWEVVQALKSCQTLSGQSQLLWILLKREGPNYTLPGFGSTTKENIENVCQRAVQLRLWSVVRFCSSILKKFVDSISPNMTSILVNQKQITIGTGFQEVLIDYPRTPTETHNLIYSTSENVCDSVLQQEILIYVGHLISTSPNLFDGIFKIRIGSGLMQAMRFYLSFKEEYVKAGKTELESLSPTELRQVLFRVLTDQNLKQIQKRQIDGSLGRFPTNFSDKVWEVLKRTRYGVSVGNYKLSSLLCSQTSPQDLNFIIEVENFILHIPAPEYRQILVELLMVMYIILERNPELNFNFGDTVDLDKLVELALRQYKKGEDPRQTILEFYQEDKNSISAFFARAILDKLLQNPQQEQCKIT
ncbi:phosphorylase b kinase regulatory subunit beta-like protein [Euroglyphus maynei]|uniref:Phosphorylase b kinase regulatory subunit n=1 Tax=Euroglyphus maynei TaxID=6958 RepID=A0A1Y3BNH3_EURMA|nr:phosphorylase b kinase regulatory subunit beta-like protein [Euroglyphus maynei]